MRRVEATGPAAQLVGALAVIALLAAVVPQYWLFLGTTALVTAIALSGLGIVTGRAGMISLCQMSFMALGAWIVCELNVLAAPGGLVVWVLVGGIAAVPLGMLLGLPALRLRGVHLAVVTLGFAAAADVIIAAAGFPGATTFQQVLRPSFIATDTAYFVFAALVFVAGAVAMRLLGRTRYGTAWRALRFSERATAAAGMSVPRAKLAAFALSAFFGGVAGGVLAGQIGVVTAQNFDTVDSLVLLVVAVMAGSEYAGGAIAGGLLMVFVPEIFKSIGIPQDWGSLMFAVGAVQTLSTGLSMSEDLVRRFRRRRAVPEERRQRQERRAAAVTPVRGENPVLVVEGLSVAYGRITALAGVDLVVPERTVMGLIGPNGAGKSTFTDAVTGFIPGATGSVTLDGRRLDGLPVHRRAAAGLRRTFQQDRVPPGLTVAGFLRFSAHRRVSAAELEEMADFLNVGALNRHVSELDVGSRRLLEVAGALLSRPKVIILDEPAAGLAHAESMELAERLTEVPGRFGASVLLIEHDLEMVRRACAEVVVLDFGEVIAAGPPATTLARPEVARAYLGDEVALA
ncbi:ATP-binding cassette domain-containing protein [Streptosporangium sp. NPDC051023]|uniref:branched-chain amino acid ABC transporter ATP-binding protein/permease n=1 Tax=Streptosporangium sp. NPDC051023 TaxID=3155410 RepID=UPI00344ED458